MSDTNFWPQAIGIPEEDWQQTPATVRAEVTLVPELQAQLEKPKEQLQLNSDNSSQPPASDQPRHQPMLWTFTRYAGVAPTNNAVERALRHGVIWRKLCYGTASERGSRFVERLLTVIATARQQGHDVLHFLSFRCQSIDLSPEQIQVSNELRL